MVTALIVAALLAAAVAAFLVLVYLRRYVITRKSGSVVMAVRPGHRPHGRGWAPGYAVYNQGELSWYRMFSLAPVPRETFDRSKLEVSDRRDPSGFEAQIFTPGIQILRCQTQSGDVAELAMTTSAVTGFLSWLEAAPPGAASSYYDR